MAKRPLGFVFVKVKYSVIIPTLNEEYFIRKNLGSIANNRDDVEIIVSDGGSTDETINAAKNHGALIVHSEKGRGLQLNAGASKANGEILFFFMQILLSQIMHLNFWMNFLRIKIICFAGLLFALMWIIIF
ncbi:MAG: glycosyltransferase [Ignavibacteriales bacterium]|nr:glycosyltransferase [Ignavibacteriales bacterium]